VAELAAPASRLFTFVDLNQLKKSFPASARRWCVANISPARAHGGVFDCAKLDHKFIIIIIIIISAPARAKHLFGFSWLTQSLHNSGRQTSRLAKSPLQTLPGHKPSSVGVSVWCLLSAVCLCVRVCVCLCWCWCVCADGAPAAAAPSKCSAPRVR
jgi:hypothetical protein